MLITFTLGIAFGILITFLIFVRAIITLIAGQFLLHPQRAVFRDSPTSYGLPFENVTFRSTDGIALKGWFIPADNPRGTIIICHGYSGNKDPDLIFAPFLHNASYNLFLFDFRGHGESAGDYTSLGYFEVQDLRGALSYLKSRADVDKNRIGVMGVSMGAAVAVLTAAKTEEIKAVVEDSGFATLRAAIASTLKGFGFPKIFVPLFSSLAYRAVGWYLKFDPREGEPIRFVKKISPRPLFIIHGEADSLVEIKNAHQLYKEAGKPKEIWTVPGIEHSQVYAFHKEEYERRTLEFWKRWL